MAEAADEEEAPDFDSLQIDASQVDLLESAGSGFTAEVFRGIWNDRLVAVKQLYTKAARRMDREEKVLFFREVRIIGRLQHKNLVQFFGVSFVDRPYWIITEFCLGGTCYDLLHHCPHIEMQWHQGHKMCTDVARAMDYLHAFQPQVIHRDLKSPNLLFVEPVKSGRCIPHVKVTDFGLARMKSATDDWEKMTLAAGTSKWMAPEVLKCTSYNEKADVYSFSMVVFEIICREVPFDEVDPLMVSELILEGRRPDLDAVPPDCPGTLNDIMVSCWAQDPSARPPFHQVLRLLEQLKCDGP